MQRFGRLSLLHMWLFRNQSTGQAKEMQRFEDNRISWKCPVDIIYLDSELLFAAQLWIKHVKYISFIKKKKLALEISYENLLCGIIFSELLLLFFSFYVLCVFCACSYLASFFFLFGFFSSDQNRNKANESSSTHTLFSPCCFCRLFWDGLGLLSRSGWISILFILVVMFDLITESKPDLSTL